MTNHITPDMTVAEFAYMFEKIGAELEADKAREALPKPKRVLTVATTDMDSYIKHTLGEK